MAIDHLDRKFEGSPQEIAAQLSDAGYALSGGEYSDDAIIAEEEEEKLEETRGFISQVGRSFWRDTTGTFGSTFKGVGTGLAYFKDKLGMSRDVDDNLVYNFGEFIAEDLGGPHHVPQRWRGGGWGFVADDLAGGIGSVVGFAGTIWATKGVLAIGGRAATGVGARVGIGSKATAAAVDASMVESQAVARTLSVGSRGPGGFGGAGEALGVETGAAGATRVAIDSAFIAKTAADAAAKTAARWDIAKSIGATGFVGAQVQGMEGYEDAQRVLLEKARSEGREYLTEDEIDTLFQAYWANYPGGIMEVLGIELPIVHRLLKGKRGKGTPLGGDAVIKYGGEKLAKQGIVAEQVKQLWKNLDITTQGRFTKGLISASARVGGSVTREALQEGSQAAWVNMVANQWLGYDENRQLLENVGSSAKVGGAIGAIFGLVSLAMGRKMRLGKDIETLRERGQALESEGHEKAARALFDKADALEEKYDAMEVTNVTAVDKEQEAEAAERDEEIGGVPADRLAPKTKEEAERAAALGAATEGALDVRADEGDTLFGAGETVAGVAPVAETVPEGTTQVQLRRTLTNKEAKAKGLKDNQVWQFVAVDKDGKVTATLSDGMSFKEAKAAAEAKSQATKKDVQFFTREGKPSKDKKRGFIKYKEAAAKPKVTVATTPAATTPAATTPAATTPAATTPAATTPAAKANSGKGFPGWKKYAETKGLNPDEVAGTGKANKAGQKAVTKADVDKAAPAATTPAATTPAATTPAATTPAATTPAVKERSKATLKELKEAREAVERLAAAYIDAGVPPLTGEDKEVLLNQIVTGQRTLESVKEDAAKIKGEAAPATTTPAATTPAATTPAATPKKEIVPGAVATAAQLSEKLGIEIDINKVPPNEKGVVTSTEVAAYARTLAVGEETAPAEGKKFLVSDEEYKDLSNQLKDLGSEMQMGGLGLAAKVAGIGMKAAFYHIERGASTFKQFAKTMIAEFGDWVKPHLAGWYGAAHLSPLTDEFKTEMPADFAAEIAEVERELAPPKDVTKTATENKQEKDTQKAEKTKESLGINKHEKSKRQQEGKRRTQKAEKEAEDKSWAMESLLGQALSNDVRNSETGEIIFAQDRKITKIQIRKALAALKNGNKLEGLAAYLVEGEQVLLESTLDERLIHQGDKLGELTISDIIQRLEDDVAKIEAEFAAPTPVTTKSDVIELAGVDKSQILFTPSTIELEEDAELPAAIKGKRTNKLDHAPFKSQSAASKQANKMQAASPDSKVWIVKSPDGTFSVYQRELTEEEALERREIVSGERARATAMRTKAQRDAEREELELFDQENDIVPNTAPEELSNEAVLARTRIEPSSDPNRLAEATRKDPDGAFEKEARSKRAKLDLAEQSGRQGNAGLDKGLTNAIQTAIANLIGWGGKYQGVQLGQTDNEGNITATSIEFKSSSENNAMFVEAGTGHQTIMVDPKKVAWALAHGHTIEEMLAHEIEHVITIKAIRKGHVKQRQKIKEYNKKQRDEFGDAAVLKSEPDEIISEEAWRNYIQKFFRNIWRYNYALAEQQAAAGDMTLLETFSTFLGNYYNVSSPLKWNPATQLIEIITPPGKDKPLRISQLLGGAEWLRYAFSQINNSNVDVSINQQKMISNSTRKAVGYISELDEVDLGLNPADIIPNGIAEMIHAATLLSINTNAMSNRMRYLNSIGMAPAVEKVVSGLAKLMRGKRGEIERTVDRTTGEEIGAMKVGATEHVTQAEAISNLLEYVVLDADAFVNAVDELNPDTPPGDGQMWVDGEQVTVSKEDWHDKDGPSVIKVGGRTKIRTLNQLVNTTGHTKEDLLRNNPWLKADEQIPSGSWALIGPSKKRTLKNKTGVWQKNARRTRPKEQFKDDVLDHAKAIGGFFNFITSPTDILALSGRLGNVENAARNAEADAAAAVDMPPSPTKGAEADMEGSMLSSAAQAARNPENDPATQSDAAVESEAIGGMQSTIEEFMDEPVTPGADPVSNIEEIYEMEKEMEGETYLSRAVKIVDKLFQTDLAMLGSRRFSQLILLDSEKKGFSKTDLAKFIQQTHNRMVTVADGMVEEWQRYQKTYNDKATSAAEKKATGAVMNDIAKDYESFMLKQFGIVTNGLVASKPAPEMIGKRAGWDENFSADHIELMYEVLGHAFKGRGMTKADIQNAVHVSRINRMNDKEGFGVNVPPPMGEVEEKMMDIFTNLIEGRAPREVGKSRGKADPKAEYLKDTEEDYSQQFTAIRNFILTGDAKSAVVTITEAGLAAIYERVAAVNNLISTDRIRSLGEGGLATEATASGGIVEALNSIKVQFEANPASISVEGKLKLDAAVSSANSNTSSLLREAAKSLALAKVIYMRQGGAKVRDTYHKLLRETQHKDYGKVVDEDWVGRVKAYISEASVAAASTITEYIKNNEKGPGGKGQLDMAAELISSLSRKDGVELTSADVSELLAEAAKKLNENKGEAIVAGDFTAALEGVLKDKGMEHHLSAKGLEKLDNIIMRNWRNSRRDQLERILNERGSNMADDTIGLKTLLASLANILNVRDTGTLSDGLKSKNIKVNGVEVRHDVVEMWQALAEAHYGEKGGHIGDKTDRQLMKLEQELAGLEGVQAAAVMGKMLEVVMDSKKHEFNDTIRDYWFATALSGIRTFVDILTGSVNHGIISTAALGIKLGVLNRGRSRGDAISMAGHYLKGLAEGGSGFSYILQTGDLSLLPDANERLAEQLRQNDFYGGETLESRARQMIAEGKAKEKTFFGVPMVLSTNPLAMATNFRLVRRLVFGLDYIGATGGRKAMILYGASTRSEMAEKKRRGWAIEDGQRVETDLEQAQIDSLRESYNAALNLNNTALRKKAEDKARNTLGPKDDPDLLKALTREYMEEKVHNDVLASSSELGRVFALNSEPIGFGGMVHKALQSSKWLKYGMGTAFSRAAINMATAASNYMPGVGWVNWARSSYGFSQAARTGRLKSVLGKFWELDWVDLTRGKGVGSGGVKGRYTRDVIEGGVTPERSAMIQAQSVMGTVLLGLAYATFDDDDDDWQVIGSLNQLGWKHKRQLLSEGVKPYSFRLPGNHYISFKNTPFAAIFTGLGNVFDAKRYGNWDERQTRDKLIELNLGGIQYMVDVGPTAQLMNLMGAMKHGQETPAVMKRVLQSFIGGTVGTIASPNILREIDTWFDPKYYKPDKDQLWAHIWSQTAFVRKYKTQPMLNAFGEPVEIRRTPEQRWYTGPFFREHGSEDPAWQIVARLSKNDVWLPVGDTRARLVMNNNETRLLTIAEQYRYRKEFGQELKKKILANADYFKEASPEHARRRLDRISTPIRKRILRELGREARAQ